MKNQLFFRMRWEINVLGIIFVLLCFVLKYLLL